MKQELKDKWVSALRSGEFLQGTNYLCKNRREQIPGRLDEHTVTRYCCLGVLCEIKGLLTAENEFGERGTAERTYDGMTSGGSYGLPSDYLVESELGLRWEELGTLWRLNDGDGGYKKHSFAEIADWIDANVVVEV